MHRYGVKFISHLAEKVATILPEDEAQKIRLCTQIFSRAGRFLAAEGQARTRQDRLALASLLSHRWTPSTFMFCFENIMTAYLEDPTAIGRKYMKYDLMRSLSVALGQGSGESTKRHVFEDRLATAQLLCNQ